MKNLLLFLLLLSSAAAQQTYAGAIDLGPFRIDRNISLESLFDRLGQPSPSSVGGDVFCYQSEDGKTFLAITRMVGPYEPTLAGVVTLSGFSNCNGARPQITPDELTKWKTDEGVGLGSNVEDVRKAYGKPSAEDKVEGTKYRWIINGDFFDGHYLKEERPELGEYVLVYRGGAADNYRASMFGIGNRRVVWIVLSKHE